MFRLKKMSLYYLDQTGANRDEVARARIAPWGVYIGCNRNEFMPMHRVLRIFIHV
jgi:hypothetical protein